MSSTDELMTRISIQFKRDKLSHALLFYGVDSDTNNQFLHHLGAMILCHDPNTKPCHHCQSCQLLLINGHPDLTLIQPEKKASAIKIDSIRSLTESSYLSPQLGFRRVIIIRRIEKMNVAASNALLKLLEEPPRDVYFILHATQLSTILPTVLSRCQKWSLQNYDASARESSAVFGSMLLSIEDPDVAKVVNNLPVILADLEIVLSQKKQFCAIAAKWLEYDLYALITVIYWINASLIKQLLGETRDNPQLNPLLPYVNLVNLFYQIDKLNNIMRQLNQSIAINGLLTLEDFLLGY